MAVCHAPSRCYCYQFAFFDGGIVQLAILSFTSSISGEMLTGCISTRRHCKSTVPYQFRFGLVETVTMNICLTVRTSLVVFPSCDVADNFVSVPVRIWYVRFWYFVLSAMSPFLLEYLETLYVFADLLLVNPMLSHVFFCCRTKSSSAFSSAMPRYLSEYRSSSVGIWKAVMISEQT